MAAFLTLPALKFSIFRIAESVQVTGTQPNVHFSQSVLNTSWKVIFSACDVKRIHTLMKKKKKRFVKYLLIIFQG